MGADFGNASNPFFVSLDHRAGDRSVDRTRTERVHANAFGGIFEGRGPRHPDDPVLRCGIARNTLVARQATDGGAVERLGPRSRSRTKRVSSSNVLGVGGDPRHSSATG